jgi:hypothetical protein
MRVFTTGLVSGFVAATLLDMGLAVDALRAGRLTAGVRVGIGTLLDVIDELLFVGFWYTRSCLGDTAS